MNTGGFISVEVRNELISGTGTDAATREVRGSGDLPGGLQVGSGSPSLLVTGSSAKRSYWSDQDFTRISRKKVWTDRMHPIMHP